MDVEVKDGLPGAGADVENSAISMLDIALASDLRRGQMASADNLGVGDFGFFQPGEMSLRNDESVCGRLRTDVLEGIDVLILVDFLGRNFARDDAAEKAV
jgi:hypothetical protein